METQNNDIVTLIAVAVLFTALFSVLMIMVVINFVRRKRKILLERQKRESQFQQDLLQAQVEMQEYTLQTISQEIHDNVGQVLSLAKMNLSILSLKDKSNEKLLDIKELVGKAIIDLRSLTTGYYGQSLLEAGLVNAIRREISQLEKTELFSVHFTAEITEIELEKNKTIFLYRMIQEIFNNILKHSEAKNINIAIFPVKDDIHIKIADDGKGFDKNDIAFKAGIG